MYFLIQTIVCAAALAAGDAQAETVPELKVTATVWVGGMGYPPRERDGAVSDGKPLYLWTGDAQATRILIPYGARSVGMNYPGQRQLYFSTRDFDPEVEDDQPPVVAATTIPPHIEECFILFVANGDNALQYRTYVLDESEAAFPRNSIRLVNLAGEPVEFVFRQSRSTLPPGAQEVFNFDPSASQSSRLMVAFQDGVNLRLTGRDLHLFEGGRITAFVSSDPKRSGRVRLHLFTDHKSQPTSSQSSTAESGTSGRLGR